VLNGNDPKVNPTSTGSAQPGIGHNRPPPDIYVREIKKLTAIEAVLKNPKFSQTQALILVGLIVRSDEGYGNAFPGGATLAVYAKVKRTDAVFKALRELEDQFNMIRRESRGQGKSNSYSVIPDRIVDAVVAAYEERKAAKNAAAALDATHPPEAGDLQQETTTPKAGELHELLRPKRVGDAQEPTRLKRAPAQTGHPPEAGATHPPKAGTYPVSIRGKEKEDVRGRATTIWRGLLGMEQAGVLYEDGKVTLHNGVRLKWLEEFGDDKSLDLALIEAAAYVQPGSTRPIDVQVEGQLAKRAREKRERDQRYAATAAKPNKGELPAWKAEINDKLARMRAANK
jgi:hypothetical protein